MNNQFNLFFVTAFVASESPAPTPSPKALHTQDENDNEQDKEDYLFPPSNRPISSQNGTVESEESKRVSKTSNSKEEAYEPVTYGAQVRGHHQRVQSSCVTTVDVRSNPTKKGAHFCSV